MKFVPLPGRRSAAYTYHRTLCSDRQSRDILILFPRLPMVALCLVDRLSSCQFLQFDQRIYTKLDGTADIRLPIWCYVSAHKIIRNDSTLVEVFSVRLSVCWSISMRSTHHHNSVLNLFSDRWIHFFLSHLKTIVHLCSKHEIIAAMARGQSPPPVCRAFSEDQKTLWSRKNGDASYNWANEYTDSVQTDLEVRRHQNTMETWHILYNMLV